MKLKTLIAEAKIDANFHGWAITWDSVPTYLMLILTELSETMESWRDNNISQFSEEIADTFIRLAHLCGDLGINIEPYIRNKMKENKKRPFHHGRKRL